MRPQRRRIRSAPVPTYNLVPDGAVFVYVPGPTIQGDVQFIDEVAAHFWPDFKIKNA